MLQTFVSSSNPVSPRPCSRAIGGVDVMGCSVLFSPPRNDGRFDNLAATDPGHKQSERTEEAVIAYAHPKTCRRRKLASHSNNTTPEGNRTVIVFYTKLISLQR